MNSNEKKLLSEEKNGRVPRLYRWYIEKMQLWDGTEYMLAYGCVTGHPRLPDTMFIHTSKVVHIEVDKENEEVVVQTLNTEYHCRLLDCNFKEPDTYTLIPDLMQYAEKYDKRQEYTLEDNSILLVLSDHQMYYFEAMRIRKNGKVYESDMKPHIGIFQDSCLIDSWGYNELEEDSDKRIDIRYFPHYQHLETYVWKTGGLPVYLENAGNEILYYTVNGDVMELKPGERKLVSKENFMEDVEVPVLDRSDLYPATVMEIPIQELPVRDFNG